MTGLLLTATAPTDTYTLSLHDALPIYRQRRAAADRVQRCPPKRGTAGLRAVDPDDHRIRCHDALLPPSAHQDRKSTRLNSSHPSISYAVFCLKKKNAAGRMDVARDVIE